MKYERLVVSRIVSEMMNFFFSMGAGRSIISKSDKFPK